MSDFETNAVLILNENTSFEFELLSLLSFKYPHQTIQKVYFTTNTYIKEKMEKVALYFNNTRSNELFQDNLIELSFPTQDI